MSSGLKLGSVTSAAVIQRIRGKDQSCAVSARMLYLIFSRLCGWLPSPGRPLAFKHLEPGNDPAGPHVVSQR
jgi:hypothetical protein